MSTITPPKAQVPIGYAMLGGQRVDVMQHPEFVRFLFDIFRRIGGASGPSNEDLQDELDQAELDIITLQRDVLGLEVLPMPQEPQPFPDSLEPSLVFPAQDQQSDGRVQALEAEVAVLRSQIEGLMQGYQV